MKKILFLVLLLSANIVIAQTHPTFRVDGNAAEWTIPLKYYDAETQLNYAIANDDSAFYFCIRATEPGTQLRLIKSGFQLSVDPKGKKKQKFNLSYKPDVTMQINAGTGERLTSAKLKNDFSPALMYVNVSGFTGIPDGNYMASDLKAVQFAMGWDASDCIIMEYKIPFSELGTLAPDKDLSFGIILLGQETPSGGMPAGDTNGSSPGMTPNTGMSPSSDMHSPQQGGMSPHGGIGGNNDMFTEKKVWTKFNLQSSK